MCETAQAFPEKRDMKLGAIVALGGAMSQREVERTLGRLLTDGGFRRNFFRDPGRTCFEVGVQLAAHELDALLRVPPLLLASLAEQLDDRICRLDIEDTNDDRRLTDEHVTERKRRRTR